GLFFRGPPATRQTYPVNWAVRERIGQLHPTPTNRLFVHARDLHEQSIGPPPHALGFHCQVPAPLLLIQSTQQQVHLSVILAARVSLTSPARPAPALVDCHSRLACLHRLHVAGTLRQKHT